MFVKSFRTVYWKLFFHHQVQANRFLGSSQGLGEDHGEDAGEGSRDQGSEEEDLPGGQASGSEVQHGGQTEHDVQSLPEDLLLEGQDPAGTGPMLPLCYGSGSHLPRGLSAESLIRPTVVLF